jgi:hypothetical protein
MFNTCVKEEKYGPILAGKSEEKAQSGTSAWTNNFEMFLKEK